MAVTQAQFNLNWVNPSMLRWAREWRGRSVDEAAAKMRKSPDEIVAWESGHGRPTARQARTLAAYYGRPFLELFLPEPLDVSIQPVIPDYRTDVGTDTPNDSWELRDIQRWAATQRENALDLYEELGESPPEIPSALFTATSTDPATIAARARDALGFSVQEQIGLTLSQADRLPALLRQRFEALGVLTLRRSDLKNLGVRGICLADSPLPVIVFRQEAPSAQAFTLAHELAHVLLRQDGITGPRTRAYDRQPVERWCDRFAAAFLMPMEQVQAIYGGAPAYPQDSIGDDEIGRLAGIFRVSPHAMLIRLVHLGYVQPAFYWDVKKPEFDAAEREHRSFGRAKYYGVRYRSSLGELYTGLVLEAWSSGLITNHNAAEYMGIKNLAHLDAIRANVGS